MNPISFTPIGIIHTPFQEMKGMPIQAVAGKGIAGQVELDERFIEGLSDLEGFSHLILIFHLHQMTEHKLIVIPYLDTEPHGVFATRSPKRPNAIGLSTVRLMRIEKNILHIEDVDILDGTPLLDIKPYVPQIDDRTNVKIDWFESKIARVNEVTAG